MGGLVIETVRPGVQFVPDAAAAFRRAEAQVRDELGRDIDTNSTLRTRAKQLGMYNAWEAYVAGRGPYPGHSKALHPDDPLAFHTKGTALDSDDWVNARIVAILAENGFIRNRLYIPGENHHFEYIRARDTNYGKKVDDVSAEEVWKYPVTRDGEKVIAIQELADAKTAAVAVHNELAPILRGGKRIPMRQDLADTGTIARRIDANVVALTAAVKAMAGAVGADPAAIEGIVRDAVKDAMRDISFTVDVE